MSEPTNSILFYGGTPSIEVLRVPMDDTWLPVFMERLKGLAPEIYPQVVLRRAMESMPEEKK